MRRRGYWIAVLLAVVLVAFQAGGVIASSEGGPPAPAGEVGVVGPDDGVGIDSITTGSSTFDPSTLVKFIPGASFVAGNIDTGDLAIVQYGSSRCLVPSSSSTGNLTEVVSPVELPDGAQITGLSFYGEDSNNASDITIRLQKTEVFTAGLIGGSDSITGSEVVSFSTSGLSGVGSVFQDVNPDELTGSTGSVLTGFTSRYYFIEVEMNNAATSSHKLCGISIFYQVPTSGDNQVFTPLTPCAIFDSRPGQGGTGIFAANETRTVTVTGDTSGQGGAGDCGIDSRATAIQVNIIVLDPTGVGTLKLWDPGDPEPQGVLAYEASLNRWNNSATVPISGADQLSIKTKNSGAHVRLVVTGYYSAVSNMGN